MKPKGGSLGTVFACISPGTSVGGKTCAGIDGSDLGTSVVCTHLSFPTCTKAGTSMTEG